MKARAEQGVNKHRDRLFVTGLAVGDYADRIAELPFKERKFGSNMHNWCRPPGEVWKQETWRA